jgi:UPF0755 protein
MRKKAAKFVAGALLVLFLFFLAISIIFYKVLFADNIRNHATQASHELLIRTGSDYEDVVRQLKKQRILQNFKSFELISRRLHYNEHVKPGRYLIKNNMGNLRLVQLLRSGSQTPVRIVINNIQSKYQLAQKVSSQLECSRSELLIEFNDPHLLDSLKLTEDNFPTLFLSNTYEFYWNTSARQFIVRMMKEYNKFWNEDRRDNAAELGLDPTGATILASIVQKESNHYDEYPRIAGVYINRLKIGMALQADPTVMFALNKLGIKRRVYKADLRINSPYNTYLHTGLPPGPICLPELKSIDQVLNAEEHDYLYFCAKDDFSGYHAFAATWEEHLLNAKNYQKALNENHIR